MPTRAEVELLRRAQGELTKRVRSELASLAGSLSGNPQVIRDTLLQIVPALVAEYGDVAATISAEWFEEVYGAKASLAKPISRDYVAKGVKYTAGHLFQGEPLATFAALDVKLDKWIKQTGRDTVRASAARHGYAWARVPTGPKTCSFCLVMASRGAVYDSQQAASQRADGDRYHGDCDCQAIAVRDASDLPEGYDPDELYDLYSTALDAASSGDIKDIAAAMRREFPDLVNDAVHEH